MRMREDDRRPDAAWLSGMDKAVSVDGAVHDGLFQ
jgi:hypothetical protein